MDFWKKNLYQDVYFSLSISKIISAKIKSCYWAVEDGITNYKTLMEVEARYSRMMNEKFHFTQRINKTCVHRHRGSKLITRSEMCHARMYVRKNAKAARLLITRPTAHQEVVITRENLSIARIFIVPLAIQSRKQHNVVWYLNSSK